MLIGFKFSMRVFIPAWRKIRAVKGDRQTSCGMPVAFMIIVKQIRVVICVVEKGSKALFSLLAQERHR